MAIGDQRIYVFKITDDANVNKLTRKDRFGAYTKYS